MEVDFVAWIFIRDRAGDIEIMEKKKYPIGPEHYTLFEEVGQGVSASVHRALCVSLNEVVAVKILDFERDNSDLVPFLYYIPSYFLYIYVAERPQSSHVCLFFIFIYEKK